MYELVISALEDIQRALEPRRNGRSLDELTGKELAGFVNRPKPWGRCQINAVKNGKVYLQMPYNYYSTNIDVALADAYFIGTVLYPEKFSDIVIEEKFDEITEKMLGAAVYAEFIEAYFGGYQQVALGS